MLSLCTRCLYPNSKPDLWFDDNGVCAACLSFDERTLIDWDERKDSFGELVANYKSKDGSNYDCIVPVSGGKDSFFQVIKCLEFGLNPLCITAVTDSLSNIGRRNLDSLSQLGVDCIEVKFNPRVRRKLNAICLRDVGDISWPEHVAIFTAPVRLAVQFGIKLIIWGENPQNEYGGPTKSQGSLNLDRRWLEEFGGLLGFRVSDLTYFEGIEGRDLIPYRYPDAAKLEKSGVVGLFLGHFFPWDGLSNALIAQAHGFEVSPNLVEGSLANYENLDNHQTGIHDYFKFLKFGFGRATDIACNHIRRGRLTRDEALEMVKDRDGAYPSYCLGKPLDEVLSEIGMDIEEFNQICDRFTNKKIFQADAAGKLIFGVNRRPLKLGE